MFEFSAQAPLRGVHSRVNELPPSHGGVVMAHWLGLIGHGLGARPDNVGFIQFVEPRENFHA